MPSRKVCPGCEGTVAYEAPACYRCGHLFKPGETEAGRIRFDRGQSRILMLVALAAGVVVGVLVYINT